MVESVSAKELEIGNKEGSSQLKRLVMRIDPTARRCIDSKSRNRLSNASFFTGLENRPLSSEK